MSKVLMCDPPSGWRYGFPKIQPKRFETGEEFHNWLISEGYPKEMITGMEDYFYCRYWEQEMDNGNETSFSERA